MHELLRKSFSFCSDFEVAYLFRRQIYSVLWVFSKYWWGKGCTFLKREF